MDDKTKKLLDRYEEDFMKYASQTTWEPKDITMMKDLQKLMYYIEVRCAMKDGDDRYEYGNGYGNGYGSGYGYGDDRRSSMNYGGNGYGGYGAGRNQYARGSGASGRRYYDNEKDNAIQRLHQIMENETNQDIRMAIRNVIHELEA